ncbi:hypothetical protein D3C86_1903630 [compost metagenome]
MPNCASWAISGGEYAISTTSGRSRTMASTDGMGHLPTRGSAAISGGWFDKASTPTSRAQAPSAHSDSVTDGSSETMRCGGWAISTLRPWLSRTP